MNPRYLLLTFACFLSSALYSHDYQISYLSIKDGLSQNEVTSIIEDKYGFIWFGTRGGLNRYDGYSFKHFKPQEGDEASLSNPSIESLFHDSKGNLWIGTKSGGLSIFDLKQDKFIKHSNLSLLPSRIISITEDRERHMWFGTWGEGLWKYVRDKDSLFQVIPKTNVKSLVETKCGTVWAETKDGLYSSLQEKVVANFQSKDIEIVDMVEDDKEPVIWVVGWNMHLVKYNYMTQSITQYKIKDVTGQLYEDTYSLCLDADGNILVGTWGQGLFVFDKNSEKFKAIDIEPRVVTKSSINYKVILDIYMDSNSIIWLGTDGGGIVKLTKKSEFISTGIRTKERMLNLHVNAFLIDSHKRKWVGTRGSGLFVAEDSVYNKIGYIPSHKYKKTPITIVKKLFEDNQGRIWVSLDEGLFLAEKSAGNRYWMVPASSLGSDIDTIRKAHDVLFGDQEMWVGTQQQGLFHFKQHNGTYHLNKHYHHASKKNYIPDDRVTAVFRADSALWIASYKGLLKFNQTDSGFVSVEKLLRNEKKPLCNIILSTHTTNDAIWFGTPCGLNELRKNEQGSYNLLELTRKDGLLDDYINAILSDQDGKIWVSTNAGLSCIDTQAKEVLNYIVSDRIGVVDFSEAASFKGKDDVLYFGNYKGLTYFDSRQIKNSQINPKFAISNFKILNNDVAVSAAGILSKNINETDTIELSFFQNEFSFDLASLDFNTPDKNQFKYQLQGYGSANEWINLGNRHRISFSNLRHGKYILRIKWTNSTGGWSPDMKNIVIIIHPPIWKTWYALLAYLLIAFGLMYVIIKIQIKQSRLKDQVKYEKQNREKDQELIDNKLKFFTDISHELRTPLTLISAPVDELISKKMLFEDSSFVMNRIRIVKRNVDKLHSLINQLLDFRKLEVGKLKLHLTEEDLIGFAEGVGHEFRQLASENAIEFIIESSKTPQLVQFDRERMQIVLHNLLSNAFKYCGNPGFVKLAIAGAGDEVCIEVSNNGRGISSEDSQHLFERFYQSKNNRGINNSGIGLSLSKTYIELHNGQIDFDSKPGELTTFSVRLKNRVSAHSSGAGEKASNEKPLILENTSVHTKSLNSKGKGATIVVVEDDAEIRVYLRELLSQYYVVIEAANGHAAFEAMIEYAPSLLISDVMMPGMDGFELCEKVKSNPKIRHIPVLLLTAKGLPEDELFGTKKGADAYMTKPFYPDLLLEKVRMLISSRKLLSQTFSKQIHLAAENIEISSKDAALIEKAIKQIEENIDNINLDANFIADKLALSASTFYRRIKKITNQTPHEFIIAIKMKIAARYLKESGDTVSEIAYKVGYNEIKTFRRNFKEIYNMSPSEYRNG